MKKENITKLLIIAVHSFIFISTLVVTLIMNVFGFTSKFQTDHFFRYFTDLSNLYAALLSVIIIVFIIINLKKELYFPKWLRLMELGAATSLLITFITVLVFLGPTVGPSLGGYFVLFEGEMFFFHFFNPVLFCLSYIFLTRGDKISFKTSLFGVIPLFIYSIIYSILVLTDIWPDFYGFTFGGQKYLFFVVFPLMQTIGYGFSLGLAKLGEIKKL